MFGNRTSRRENASMLLDFQTHREGTRSEHPTSAQVHFGNPISRIRHLIGTLVSIAADHGSSISSAELVLLLPQGAFASSTELESFVACDPSLREELLVRDGQVTLKGSESLARERIQQVELSEERAQAAQAFSDRLVRTCPWIRIVAISGSTAYAGSRRRDDVDFYLVTRRKRLWITLLFALTSARFHRLRSSDSPQLCFNRILEENECLDAFRSDRDPLFAREALSLRILQGRDYYRELLSSAAWMEEVFPVLFRQAIKTTTIPSRAESDDERRGWLIVNAIAFAALAPYLMVVGLWRNHRLLRAGRLDARFRTVMRPGFFAYESRKYDLLRDKYSKVF